jgi:hypothetical protein
MCPVSTAIFLRIAADYAIDQMKTGANPQDVIPFWRVISSKDKIASKLKIEPAWLDHQRKMEQSDIQP